MSTIAERYGRIRAAVPAHVTLVAVSKYHTVDDIREAYAAGARDFGESREQELADKASQLPQDIRWHFIGHLQRNKVRKIIGLVHLIHSVDSLRLLREIDQRAAETGRVIDCLLQVHVAAEETKFGFTPQELIDCVHSGVWQDCKHARIRGLMAMATNTDDRERVAADFNIAAQTMASVRHCIGEEQCDILSMGMSGDYRQAIDAGSTMVRVGSAIFTDSDGQ